MVLFLRPQKKIHYANTLRTQLLTLHHQKKQPTKNEQFRN
jgi:hypothetical protein